jgi:hypothetical protein
MHVQMTCIITSASVTVVFFFVLSRYDACGLEIVKNIPTPFFSYEKNMNVLIITPGKKIDNSLYNNFLNS